MNYTLTHEVSIIVWLIHYNWWIDQARIMVLLVSAVFLIHPTSTDREASATGEGSEWKCWRRPFDPPEGLHHLLQLHLKSHQLWNQGEHPLRHRTRHGTSLRKYIRNVPLIFMSNVILLLLKQSSRKHLNQINVQTYITEQHIIFVP